MHEVALAHEIVAVASRCAQGARVRRVIVEVGALAAVLPEALALGFEAAKDATLLAQAVLEIRICPGAGRCRSCGSELPLEVPYGMCKCGSTDLEIERGQELHIHSIEVDACAERAAVPIQSEAR